jgi:hypothetical protein
MWNVQTAALSTPIPRVPFAHVNGSSETAYISCICSMRNTSIRVLLTKRPLCQHGWWLQRLKYLHYMSVTSKYMWLLSVMVIIPYSEGPRFYFFAEYCLSWRVFVFFRQSVKVNIACYFKLSRRMRYTEHVARMMEMANVYKILVRKQRPLGRSQRR